jgi:hypothetical protein
MKEHSGIHPYLQLVVVVGDGALCVCVMCGVSVCVCMQRQGIGDQRENCIEAHRRNVPCLRCEESMMY